jgi:aminodeoxyfutalosine deaminase
MAFLTAERIHNGHGWLPQGTVIEIAADGTITALHDTPQEDAAVYEGILTPGFVNAHCHLELSHMKDAVPVHTGLIPFLKCIPTRRDGFTDEQKKKAREDAYNEVLHNGIVAVGDIANTTDTLDLRAIDKLHFYTFVESIGFTEEHADKFFDFSLQTYNKFAAQPRQNKLLKQGIAPHAPYSVSAALFRLIGAHNSNVTTIHNQENEDENRYYTDKEGAVRELLAMFNIDDSPFVPTGKSSLQSYLQWMVETNHLLFVHNTYSKREDVQFAHSRVKEAWWCLCPNANLYIENKLPDIDMLISEHANICIGTDSLASNHQLCVLSELFTIREHYPQLEWEQILKWATHNGARALQMQDIIGSIEVGKKPGIVQVTGLDNKIGKPAVHRII